MTEAKLAKVGFIHQTVFQLLIGFGRSTCHVIDVPVPQIKAHNRAHLLLQRVKPAVKGDTRERIVRFAAKIEVRNEQIPQVFFAVSLHVPEIVPELLINLVRANLQRLLQAFQFGLGLGIAVFFE